MIVKELLKSVFLIRPNDVKDIIEESNVTLDRVRDVLCYSGKSIPLYYIPKWWNDMLCTDFYEEKDFDIVRTLHDRNREIMEYMEEKWGVSFDSINVEYCDFRYGVLFKSEMDDSEDYCLAVDEAELDIIYNNYRKEDIELYCAVDKLDIKSARKLLECGASPFVFIHSQSFDSVPDDEKERRRFYIQNDASNVCERITQHLCDQIHMFGFMDIVFEGKVSSFDYDRVIMWLMDVAAHAEMRNLVLEYCEEKDKDRLYVIDR